MEKAGKLWHVTDFEAHKDFHVKPEWVRNLVENGKITIAVAKDIYARTCIDVQRNCSNLSAVQEYRKEKALQSYMQDIHQALLRKQLPVQDPPAVALWKAQYMQVEERYKFLVLCGPSQTGKTMWARTAFGTRELCFEVNCSSGQEPALQSFDLAAIVDVGESI